jgi:sterol desaturase/sphingolipid hydroxylase (fatty acid hydroxylase superfamily)
MPYPEPTLYAIPLFLALLAVEPGMLAAMARRGAPVRGYERRDAVASVGLGIGSIFFTTFINLAVYGIACRLWVHRVTDLGSGVLGWTVAMIGWDFSYYWHHRAEHEMRILWACHVNHHSSRYYNLSTALRQPWTPVAAVFFYPWWALVGVAPRMILMSAGFNLIYQYWIHTEVIGRMPRWFEAVFNTPSHHRVHHGSNAEYLDKNYGGILIVWDRLFGTFEPERAAVDYGLTKNIDTFSLFSIAFHEYAAIAHDLRRARNVRERVRILFKGPAWRAPSLERG